MLCDNRPVNIKQHAYGLLCKPHITILNPYLNVVIACFSRENKEINGSIPNLNSIIHPNYTPVNR